MRDARVRDEQVEPARLVEKGGQSLSDRLRRTDIAGKHGVAAGQVGGEIVELARRSRCQPDDRAACCQRPRERGADPS